jgi:hypothetical protein
VINYGAELFNKQADHAGCYRVYQGALISVRPYMGPAMRKRIDESIAKAETLPVYSDRAFELRKMLDEIRAKAAPTMKPAVVTTPKIDAPPKVGVPTGNPKDAPPRVDLPKIVDVDSKKPIDDKKGDPIIPPPPPPPFDPIKPNPGSKPPVIEEKKSETPKINPLDLPPLPGTKPPVIEEKKDPPKVDTPKVDLPKVDLPKVDLPKVDTPKVEVPGIDIPTPPKKETPKDTPKTDLPLPKIELPGIDPPKVDAPKKETPKDPPPIGPPSIDLPKKEAPKIELPGIDLPSIDPKGNKEAKTAEVSGAITVDGKGLPAGFFITLVSAEGKRFTTIVQKEGVYRFGTMIPMGPYRVAVEPALGVDAKVIPARYQDAATSGLTIQVDSGKVTGDLRLTK